MRSPRRRALVPTLPLLLWAGALQLSAHARDIPTVAISERGTASLTRYDVPLGVLTSCGCSTNSTYFPTAALSQAAYGSALASGPACGQCFNLTLTETLLADPPWVLNEEQRRNASIVVKITDKCPAPRGEKPGNGWCGATGSQANRAGFSLHFDLSAPSPSVPLSFFPVNSSYGYSDYGGWAVEFEQVSCDNWAGWSNQTALGLDPSLTSEAGCCPANPLVDNNVCPAFSLTASAPVRWPSSTVLWFLGFFVAPLLANYI